MQSNDEPERLLESVLSAQDLSAEAFKEMAREKYGIDGAEKTSPVDAVWRVGDPPQGQTGEYILSPYLGVGIIALLYSLPGVGKTSFAALIGTLVATGKAVDHLQAPTCRKVLFLRCEQNDGLQERLNACGAVFGKATAREIIMIFPDNGSWIDLNLESDADWESIARMVDAADLIIIDHLSKATSGRNDLQSWRRLERKLKECTRRGKTILLLHHTGKDGQQRGTSHHVADIDIEISMQSIPDVRNGALIEFGKVRDNASLGKNFEPFKLGWDRNQEAGSIKWWTEETKEGQGRKWMKPPNPNAVPHRAIDKQRITDRFVGREAAVLLHLAEIRLQGRTEVKRKEIQEHLRCSATTARSVCDSLIGKGVLVLDGQGKATSYRLREGFLDEILR